MTRGVPKKKEPDAIDIHVGRRIRMRRVWRDMTQVALAGAIGLTFQQVQKYEKGTNRVSASRLTEIAAVLDVAPSYFFLLHMICIPLLTPSRAMRLGRLK